jgi:hypothetical protein
VEIAKLLKEPSEVFSSMLSKGKIAFEEKLWNGILFL